MLCRPAPSSLVTAWAWSHATIRRPCESGFSGVRIRKLPYGPLMELSDHKVLLQETAKMVDLDPDNWFARFVRGTTYSQLQRFDEALVDLRELARLQPDADGVFYYTGMTLAALKKYDEAVAMFQRALEKNPENHPVLRSWAELELDSDDPRFRNPRSALERALKAYELSRQFSDAWECSGTLAHAYAELGRWNDAILHAEEACKAAPPESVQVCQTQLAKYREAKRSSFPAAVASLLWEGDITRRVLGLALLIVLLAANLILVKRLARFGRLTGALAGTLAAAISFAIPAVMAVMVGLGEGPAFLKLLAGIVIAAAACGALAGVWAGAKLGECKPA